MSSVDLKLSADLWLDTAVIWKTTPKPAFATAPELFPDPGQRHGVLSGKLFGVQKQGEVGNQKSSAGSLLISLFFLTYYFPDLHFVREKKKKKKQKKTKHNKAVKTFSLSQK